ncbi:MAG: SRPBCC family protein [Anaerolineae bacterium]|nr:SRPBCC family protein [Anaerolineae bacterium]
MARWQANTVSAEWTSADTPGVGSTFVVVTRTPVGTTEAVMEITIWEPPIRHGFKSTTMPFPFKGIAGVTTLEPTENGTQLTLQGQVTTVGILRLVEGLLSKQVKKQDASNNHTLKQLLEAGV